MAGHYLTLNQVVVYDGLADKHLVRFSTHMQREIEDLTPKESASIKHPIDCGVDCFCEVLEV